MLPGVSSSQRAATATPFARCDLGGDHAPWDRLAAWQLSGSGRGPDNNAEPAAADIPAVDADVDSGELIAAQLPQVLVMDDASDGRQVGRARASRRAAITTSAGARALTPTAWARTARDDHRGGQAVVCRVGSPPASGPSASAPVPAAGAACGSRITIPACAYRDRGAALSRSDSRWRERALAVDLDQLVACGRARDDRHLRRRDADPPCHGADHGCVGPPIGGGSRTHSWSVEPSHSRRSVRALGWTRTVSRVRPAHRVPAAACRRVRNVIDHRSSVTGGCGAAIVSADADLLEAAGWLHDIGYAPDLAVTGLHALDGARYLRDAQHADAMLCRLVAHHSYAIFEAEERGLADVLGLEFEPAPYVLSSVLTCCDMTASPVSKLQLAGRSPGVVSRPIGCESDVVHLSNWAGLRGLKDPAGTAPVRPRTYAVRAARP